jgi:hypothetical protein
MGASTGVTDLGTQYRSYERSEKIYRPLANVTYNPGSVLQNVAKDLEIWTDEKGVQLSATAAAQQSLVGVVAETWPGFNASITPGSFTSAASFTAFRGTVGIETVTQGYHPAILLDQSGTGAVTVVDKLPLIASRATAGYAQGVAATAPLGGTSVVANAKLPASGIGSSLTAAALAQAAQTDTLTGAPAVGDTLSVTIQSPYINTAPGTAQTITWTTPPLTAAQAVSVTTAALALLTYLNAQPSFSQYFIATQVAGVVTITVNALANPFRINFGSGMNETNFFNISLSGMVANSLTFAVASTGGTTSTAGAANLAAGTGYKGIVPGYITVGGGT